MMWENSPNGELSTRSAYFEAFKRLHPKVDFPCERERKWWRVLHGIVSSYSVLRNRNLPVRS